MPSPRIESLDWIVLDCGGVPAKLADCRRLHGCPRCRGERLVRGVRCGECQGTGVGPIQGKVPTYCPSCSKTNMDGIDARLQLSSRDLPPPEPKPEFDVPDSLVDRHGHLKRMTAAEREKEAAASKRNARLMKNRYAAKAKEKKAAARAAEKAKPRYVAPWKQPA